jgi:hypothetical protein
MTLSAAIVSSLRSGVSASPQPNLLLALNRSHLQKQERRSVATYLRLIGQKTVPSDSLCREDDGDRHSMIRNQAGDGE